MHLFREESWAIKIAEPLCLPPSLPKLQRLESSSALNLGTSNNRWLILILFLLESNSFWQKTLSFITFTVKLLTQILSSSSPTTKARIIWPFHRQKDQNWRGFLFFCQFNPFEAEESWVLFVLKPPNWALANSL